MNRVKIVSIVLLYVLMHIAGSAVCAQSQSTEHATSSALNGWSMNDVWVVDVDPDTAGHYDWTWINNDYDTNFAAKGILDRQSGSGAVTTPATAEVQQHNDYLNRWYYHGITYSSSWHHGETDVVIKDKSPWPYKITVTETDQFYGQWFTHADGVSHWTSSKVISRACTNTW